MPQLTNKDVARILKETASLIDLTGGNEFRARAFSSAARTIERLDEPIEKLVASGELKDVRGIGAGLAAQIEEILERGTFEMYDELVSAIPPGLMEILRVKGLGAKKVRKMWQALGITTLEEVQEAALIGRLAELDGFGAKTQENILANIKLLKQYGSKRRYADALVAADPVLERIRSVEGVAEASFAGDIRRKMEIVSEVAIVIGSDDPGLVADALAGGAAFGAAERRDGTRVDGRLPDGLPLKVHVVSREQFASTLWQETGSRDHVSAFEKQYAAPGTVRHETDIYAVAGLAFIEPELREGRGELEAAERGFLPNLISEDDLHGTLHNHSTYSDGAHSIRQMVEAARSMGFSYYGVCDHSRSLYIAKGLPIERVEAQQAEIEALNSELATGGGQPFRIFKGTESDILEDGSLDYPREVLSTFDFVVASVHQGFRMTREEATERIIKAVENPFTTILGHASGRLLLRREGYPIDHERIIDACAANDVVIEINSNPRRLDMDWRWIHHALDRGVMVSINPDAHSIHELYYHQWGVAVARKGWVTADRCLNAKPLEEFSGWIDERRRQRAGIAEV